MKKQLIGLMALVSLNSIFAGSEDSSFTLDAKVVIDDSCGYFVLSDGSMWKVFNFNPRWRSIQEWWNNTQLMPESYKSVPSDWFEGATLEIVDKKQALSADEHDSLNQQMLGRCSHMFYNVNADKFLFATPLKNSLGLLELYNDSFKSGYQKGFQKGQLDANIDASKQFEKGYNSGYHEALKDVRARNANNPNCVSN